MKGKMLSGVPQYSRLNQQARCLFHISLRCSIITFRLLTNKQAVF